MADINYRCPQCGRGRKLSEYADPKGIICPDCNVRYEAEGAPGSAAAPAMRADAPGRQEKPALKLRQREADAPAPLPEQPGPRGKRKAPGRPAVQVDATLPQDVAAAQEAPDESAVRPAYVREARRPVSHAWLAALLFLVIGGIMWGFRYGGWLPPEALGWMIAYGWIVALAFHILIVLKAMSDNMLQGVLTLLVPGYSLYYIFVVSDDFFMRAVLAGLLVGIGQDALHELNWRIQHVMAVAHKFIQEGGGEIRR